MITLEADVIIRTQTNRAVQSTGAGDLTVILAATVWAGILGLALDLALTGAQRRLLRWHRAHLGETG